MTICMAYSSNRDDARELLNDGFLKAFNNLNKLQNTEVVRPWLRQIMVNTALDYYRKHQHQWIKVAPEDATEHLVESESVLAQISAEEILTLLQQLPPMPRLVFGLYVLEGYSHQEISQRLHIAESTSRAYLTDANQRLRRALIKQNEPENERIRR